MGANKAIRRDPATRQIHFKKSHIHLPSMCLSILHSFVVADCMRTSIPSKMAVNCNATTAVSICERRHAQKQAILSGPTFLAIEIAE
jgi:hypothetical protein